MSVQLHRYTNEIINALSVRKVFSAVLVRRILNSWLSEAQQQKLTFGKGARMWCKARDSAVLGGLVRIGSNPSGSRPNFFGRQHLTFDKGGKFSARDSAENLIDGADGEQSLR